MEPGNKFPNAIVGGTSSLCHGVRQKKSLTALPSGIIKYDLTFKNFMIETKSTKFLLVTKLR
jgi:hypothetical protein